MSLSSRSAPFRKELDAWNAAGLVARFWWRDDDAVTVTPQLRRLLTVSNDFGIGAGVAVIPKQAKVELVDAICPTRCCIWQHGWGHDFYESGEFGNGRRLGAMISDALEGRNALDALCGESGWQRVFVPPNHGLAMDFKNLIPALGYTVLSAGVPLTPEVPHVAELNAEVDVMDWPRGRVLGEDDIFILLAAQLAYCSGGDRCAAPSAPHPCNPGRVGIGPGCGRGDHQLWTSRSAGAHARILLPLQYRRHS